MHIVGDGQSTLQSSTTWLARAGSSLGTMCQAWPSHRSMSVRDDVNPDSLYVPTAMHQFGETQDTPSKPLTCAPGAVPPTFFHVVPFQRSTNGTSPPSVPGWVSVPG